VITSRLSAQMLMPLLYIDVRSFIAKRDWTPIFVANFGIIIFFSGVLGLEISYALITLVNDVNTFHWCATALFLESAVLSLSALEHDSA
jgi:hypothetical protein